MLRVELSKEKSVFGHSMISMKDVVLSVGTLRAKSGKFQAKYKIDRLWFLCAKHTLGCTKCGLSEKYPYFNVL